MERRAHGFRIEDFNRLAVDVQSAGIATPVGVSVARFTNARRTGSHAG
jgi:hypothetical protein